MFKKNVVTGVLVLAPFGAVLWLLIWLWSMLLDLTVLLPDSFRPYKFLMTIPLLMLIVFFVWSVGFLSRYYIGTKIIEGFSKIFSRVPVINTVYLTLEQLLKTFTTGKAKNFRRVVQIEYPRKGLYTLAFVTGEKSGLLTVFVPTTPNPTSGFYLMIAADEVKELKMTVEEALKEIISMGIVQNLV
jgi:uncharacterized membrane protein